VHPSPGPYENLTGASTFGAVRACAGCRHRPGIRSLRIRRSIEEKLGVEEAAYLIEGRPPDGWGTLITGLGIALSVGQSL